MTPTPNLETIIHNFANPLEPPVQHHLKNVYGTLSLTCAAAATGAYLDMYTWFQVAGWLSAAAGFLLLILLLYTPHGRSKTILRLSYLLGSGLATGMNLGPLLNHAIALDPTVIMSALLATTLVFVSFSFSALLAKRGSWLFLGGPLLALSSYMFVTSLGNVFLQSPLLATAELYLGLVNVCGYVLYDTQIIIEKRRMGSEDFITHSLLLFSDYIGIFANLLGILITKKDKKRNVSDDDVNEPTESS